MKDFIKKPPMGWNSWDCYGAGVTEDELLGNAEFMRDRLKQYGYQYVVCDIQWYEPAAKGNVYNNFADLCMDEYSRLIPAVNRFPSSVNGAGFKPIADKIHSMGLIRYPHYARYSASGGSPKYAYLRHNCPCARHCFSVFAVSLEYRYVRGGYGKKRGRRILRFSF